MPKCCLESVENGYSIYIYCNDKKCEYEFCGECRTFIGYPNSPDCSCENIKTIIPDEFIGTNNQQCFENIMRGRNISLRSVYARGIKALDDWYGDKGYRQFDRWAEVIDDIIDELKK